MEYGALGFVRFEGEFHGAVCIKFNEQSGDVKYFSDFKIETSVSRTRFHVHQSFDQQKNCPIDTIAQSSFRAVNLLASFNLNVEQLFDVIQLVERLLKKEIFESSNKFAHSLLQSAYAETEKQQKDRIGRGEVEGLFKQLEFWKQKCTAVQNDADTKDDEIKRLAEEINSLKQERDVTEKSNQAEITKIKAVLGTTTNLSKSLLRAYQREKEKVKLLKPEVLKYHNLLASIKSDSLLTPLDSEFKNYWSFVFNEPSDGEYPGDASSVSAMSDQQLEVARESSSNHHRFFKSDAFESSNISHTIASNSKVSESSSNDTFYSTKQSQEWPQ